MNVASVIVAWLVAPAMFFVVVAAVQAWNTDSVTIALFFVVLPLAAWIAISRSCKAQLHEPVFAPSFIASLIVIMCVNHIVILRSATSAGLDASFGVATVTLCLTFWRMIVSDPGRLPIYADSRVAGGQDGGSKADLARSGQALGPLMLKPLAVRDLEVNDGECVHAFISPALLDRDEDESTDDGLWEGSPRRLSLRSRVCRRCNARIDHFDHHCPAIMNCVGRKNHVLFLGMLVTFIVVELLYVQCGKLYLEAGHLLSLPTNSPLILSEGLQDMEWIWRVACQVMSREPWVTSTLIFACLQACWQAPLLAFHIFCAAFNLTTNEWIKWEKYPALYVRIPAGPGRPLEERSS